MSQSFNSNWNYPTQVSFGPGRISQIAESCQSQGIKQPLIVTDPGLASLPMIQDIRDMCRANGLNADVFSDVAGNPNGGNVTDGVAALHQNQHDGVVAVGGGSALDVGKAIALMAGQDRPLWDFEDIGDNYTRVKEDGVIPCIAVPTTAGTGSEVGRSSVIVHEAEARKVIIFHPSMMPGLVIADPNLSLSLPKKLTAATGIDALSHNLEAYCASGFHPMADGIAVEGIRLIDKWLVTAVEDGNHLEARSQMLIASMMGATAFQKGLGAMHAMSHPVGAQLKAHHGLINAIVMPYVLAWNFGTIRNKLDRLATYMGLADPTAHGFIAWVLELRKRVEIPHTLDSLGMSEAHVGPFSKMAELDPAGTGNPVLIDAKGYETLFRHALSGRLPNY
jgi:alcohol dehydrogenase class IV